MHYCEPSVKRQWEAMETAEDPHSWEDFKEEIEDMYPEYREVEKGSVPGLEKAVVLKSKKPVKVNDYKGLR